MFNTVQLSVMLTTKQSGGASWATFMPRTTFCNLKCVQFVDADTQSGQPNFNGMGPPLRALKAPAMDVAF